MSTLLGESMVDLGGVWMVGYDKTSGGKVRGLPFRQYCVGASSPFLENDYIRDLILRGEHRGKEWFGVLSPLFFNKALAGGLTVDKIKHDIDRGIRRKIGRNVYVEEEVEVLGFHPGHKNRNIIHQGARYHGRPRGEVFVEMTQEIFDKAGVRWNVDDHLDVVVYNNYVLAKPYIYERYYREILGPCMRVMEEDEDLRKRLFRDATYHKSKRMSMKLKREFGVPYYPFHPFICERFWAVFLKMNPEIKFRHYGR